MVETVSLHEPVELLLPGGGAMGEAVRRFDWARNPLGPIATWPHPLRNAVTLMLNSPESMYLLWGPDLVFLFNDAYRPILGPRLPTALGQSFRSLWADAWEAVRPAVERALAGQSSEFKDAPIPMARYGVPEKTWWTFSYSPIHDEAAKPAGVFCITNETTARLRADAALRASQTHLRALNAELERKVSERTSERNRLWQLSPDLLGVLNAEGYFEESNPAWQSILGWTAAELRATRLFDLLHPEDLAQARLALAEIRSGVPLLRILNRFRTIQGGYRWMSWLAVPEGERIYCSARDVTEEKQQQAALVLAEETLRQSQKLEAMGQLTGGVAHDFNNLLTVIKSATDLLKRPNLSPDRQARYIEAISNTVARAATLTGQLLSFARRQALRPSVFDAGHSIRMLEEMIGTLVGARAKLVLVLPEQPCFIRADSSQFDTAMVNILANARDAMEGDGCITITVRPVEAIPAVRQHPARAVPAVAVSISDTGEGIAPDRLERIFEPFFTTKPVGQGTGLGLSQVFGFAKQSGGEVDVQSSLGEGTTFTLYLPRTTAPVGGGEPDEHAPPPEGHGTRVLVIEDNAEVGEFVTQMLADLGYRTTWVTHADAALAELEARPEAHDIVFSDVVMPGMNGVALGREIQRRYPGLPVIMTSGYSEVLARDGEHGFDLVQKPYSVESLSRALHKASNFLRNR